jgi:hypothetical protein
MEVSTSRQTSVKTDWSNFYRDYFKFFTKHDFGYLKDAEDGERHLIVHERLNLELLVSVMSQHFPVNFNINKDIFSRNARSPFSSYSIVISDGHEADARCLNLSVNDLWYEKLIGLTLMERLLLELKHYAETGQHLDCKVATICSGSWTKEAEFPTVAWDSEKGCLSVNIIDFNDSGDFLSARLVLN